MIRMDIHKVLLRPVSTEKAIKMMEGDNKLTFIVNRRATKEDIRHAFEELFQTKVVKVNTLVAPSGEKKAIIKLPADKPALDIATQLGIM